METLIRFDTFAAVSFALAASMFLHMFVRQVAWFVRQIKKK